MREIVSVVGMARTFYRSRLLVSAICVAVLLVALAGRRAIAGPAINQFEIKTLGAEPGAIEIQSQNDFSIGNPRRETRPDASGGIIADDNTITQQREGLEVEMGITPFLKARLGVEFEQSRIDDPRTFSSANSFNGLEFDEYGAETIWTLIPRKGDGFGAGVLVEYDQSAHSDEASTLTLGPIFEWASGPWSASFNPTIIQYFGGPLNDDGKRDHKRDFGYAAQVMYTFSDQFASAVEAYGGIETIGNSGDPNEVARLFGDFNQHRLGPVLYWTFEGDAVRNGKRVETTLGLGALFGLNKETPDATMKVSLEVNF